MKLWFDFPSSAASERTRAIRRRSLLLAVIGIAVLPLAWRGPSCGQDFDFHLQNWIELAQSWHQGVFYPHWVASANYGTGEPRFVFYPPFPRFLGAALGLILPRSWTPLAFTGIALFGAGFSLRAMAREWITEDSATLAACLYVVNPYMMFVVYERGALAELLAATWIPLLVLYGLRRKPSIVPLALTVAALWLTNAPAGVMGTYALAIVVFVAALQEREGRLAARATAAVALGLGLAGFWLIPALYEQRWVEIARATGPLMRVEDSFFFGFSRLSSLASPVSSEDRFNLMYHNQVLLVASWIVLALLVATAVAAWFSRACLSGKNRKPLWLPLVVLSAVVCILQFPWSDLLWRITPELRFLQFPWRWMLVLGMTFAVLAGMASDLMASFSASTRASIAVRAVLILLLACGISAWASLSLRQHCDAEDNVAAQVATFHYGGFEGTDEYTPRGVNNSLIQRGLPLVRVLATPNAQASAEEDNSSWSADPATQVPAQIAITRWQSESIVARIEAPRPAWAVLRLLDYPAWRAVRDGTEIQNRPQRTDGLMVIPLREGINQVEIHWRATGDQRVGFIFSLIAVAVTLALAFAGRWNAQKVPLP
ncbi:MAG TPA: 6-pyruvoyl-tetrahydropterin synthase-related protein [Acidobacteriaceae bacterium]|nr:6-pyruvoyl-tetrahydropterin synthase-related protein [Acidobacteriaceae bacterium]